MRESKSVTFVTQQGMNRKMKKLSRQGWRVVSTTNNILGGIVATLERDPDARASTSAGPVAPGSDSPCSHSNVHVVMSPIKHSRVCNQCDLVVDVVSYSSPSHADPESLQSLRDWASARPAGDSLARFITDAISDIRHER